MFQLHDLSKYNSMIAFRFDDLEALKKQAKDIVKGLKKYHIVILDTKNDRIVYEKQK